MSAAPSSDRAPVLAQLLRELADRRRLAGAVDADDEDHARRRRQVERAGSPNIVGDLLRERRAEVAELVPRLEPADELGGRADADVALDQRLLEPLPGLVVAGVEGRGGELPVSARRLLPSESRSRPKKPCCSSAVSSGPSASPSSSAQLLAIGAER